MKKAAIMAGGFGTRLRPLTMSIPKPMVPIINVPMMEHIVNLLKKANITDIVSVLYFQPDVITKHFKDGKDFGINMNYVLAQADYGTAGSIKNSQEHLKERFIIISGDVLTDVDLSKALEFHIEKKSKATILLTRVTDPLQYGIVMTDDNGKITRFLEKPSWGQVFSDTINTGIYILEPEVLDLIPFQEEFDFSKDLFPLMLEKEMPLYGFIAEGYWRDVGNLTEYLIGQHDAISGTVKLDAVKADDTRIVYGKNCKLANNIKFSGAVFIGENCTIGENVELTNCVIGNNCNIGNGTRIMGATIWDNVQVSEYSEINDSVVCFNTKIGSRVTIEENVFIAENCDIQDDVQIKSNVKLWPGKYIESRSTLFRSMVQEDKWMRELFSDARITGESNIDIHPEFGSKLGESFGLTLGPNSSVLASRDPDGVSRIIKRAISSGLMSVGVSINDIQQTSIPQTRQEIRTGKYDGGIHIRRSPRNPDETDIILFNKDGRDISIASTKKIERYFYGEEIKRVHWSKVGKINYPERTNEIYVNRFLESVDVDIIRQRHFKILMDYSYGLASAIFPNILGSLKAEVLSLHNYVDGSKFHPDPNDYDSDNDDTGKIMRSLGYEIGFRMQAGAEKVSVIDERGKWYTHQRLLSIMTKLFLETNKEKEPYKIAVSIVATNEIEEIAKEYNVEVIRIKNSHSAMMDATVDESIKFVGGIYGGYIFSDFLFASDGMFTVGKILEMIAKTNLSISQLDDILPRRYQKSIIVSTPWESKGTVMRKAMQYTNQFSNRQLVEGIKIIDDNESVLLLPGKEIAAFQVVGESSTINRAEEIANKYAELITKWKES